MLGTPRWLERGPATVFVGALSDSETTTRSIATLSERRSKRILLVRMSAIGDVVMASPVASALRRAHPDAFIVWLVQPETCPLVVDHPAVDEVIVWPVVEWKALWTERRFGELWKRFRALQAKLRGYRFDLAIDMQGLLKSGFLVWLTRAPERISLGASEGSRMLMTRVLSRYAGIPALIGTEYHYLAVTLGLPVDDFRMVVGLSESSQQRAGQMIDEAFGSSARFAAIIHCTTRPQKHWVEEYWVELMRRLRQEHDLGAVVLGGPSDEQAGERLTQAAEGGVNLAGRTSLQEAAAVISRAALVVGVDTGLTHIGTAFARPTICLFGSTRPYLNAGPKTRVLYQALPCSPCRRRPTCGGRFDCMRELTVSQVLATTQELMVANEPVESVD